MRPRGYDDDFMIVDAALDHPMFPTEVIQGINALAHNAFNSYDFEDGYVDFSEIEFEEHRNHWSM